MKTEKAWEWDLPQESTATRREKAGEETDI